MVLSALFVGLSPFARDAAGLVLSDVFVAALMVAMLPLLKPVTRSGARLAGALAGFATVARITAGVSLIGLLAALPRRLYKSVLLFAIPPLIGLALLQWALFGSPTKTGYKYWGVRTTFSLSYLDSASVLKGGPWIFPDRLNGELLNWTCPCRLGGPQASLPNLTFYPLQLADVSWVFSPPFVPLFGLLLRLAKATRAGRCYALIVTALTMVAYMFYWGRETRFIAGPTTVLTVLASVRLAELAARLWKRRPSGVRAPAHRTPGSGIRAPSTTTVSRMVRFATPDTFDVIHEPGLRSATMPSHTIIDSIARLSPTASGSPSVSSRSPCGRSGA